MSESRGSYVWDMCRLGTRTISRRPWRALLTFLTIMLAIGCVVSTVAVLQGATAQVTDDIRGFGVHCVNIYSPQITNPIAMMSGQRANPEVKPLTLADSRALVQGISGARSAPVRFQLARIVGPRSTRLGPAIATTPEFRGTFDSQLLAGRFLEPSDIEQQRPVCALDVALAVDLMTSTESTSSAETEVREMIGQEIELRLNGEVRRFEVVGIFEDPISLRDQLNAFDNDSARLPLARLLSFKNVYLPLTWMMQNGESTPLQAIYLDLSGTRDLDLAARAVRPLLEKRGHEELVIVLRRDWIDSVVSGIRTMSSLGNITWIVTLMIALIMTATISLVAIRERLPEVALRRVEGALRRDILLQFVTESVIVSGAAGAAGIGLGVLATRVLLATVLPWEPLITLGSFVLAALLSVAVGVLATVLPAYRATRLDPIHFLRNL